mmetsp:Transcript_96962/g.222089  ORF Transcript_96962/g.222089 Transcript_96962/m.222089 type:complete len:209 (-) Transcript_96962:885-1511(-)
MVFVQHRPASVVVVVLETSNVKTATLQSPPNIMLLHSPPKMDHKITAHRIRPPVLVQVHHPMSLQVVHDILRRRAELILRYIKYRLPRFRISGPLPRCGVLSQLQVAGDYIRRQQSLDHDRGSDICFVGSPHQGELLLLPLRDGHSAWRHTKYAPVRVAPAHRPGRPVVCVEGCPRLEVKALVQGLDAGQYSKTALHPLGIQIRREPC